MATYGDFALKMSDQLSLRPVIRGGTIVFTADGALRLLDVGEERGIFLAGVDAFELSEVSGASFIQPFLEHSIDFTQEEMLRGSMDAPRFYAAARALIESRRHLGLHFELVFDE